MLSLVSLFPQDGRYWKFERLGFINDDSIHVQSTLNPGHCEGSIPNYKYVTANCIGYCNTLYKTEHVGIAHG